MRGRHVPVTERRRLVEEQSGMQSRLHLADRVGEIQIRRRRLHRIDSPTMRSICTRPAFMSDDELAQRRVLVGRHDLRRRLIAHRRAHVAERLIHGVRERMHGRRLRLAREHERRAAVRRQILGDGVDVGVGAPRCRTAHLPHPHRSWRRSRARSCRSRSPSSAAVIGVHAGHRRRRLGNVQAVQAIGLGVETAARRELSRIAKVRGAFGRQEVGVERDDDVGPGEFFLSVPQCLCVS